MSNVSLPYIGGVLSLGNRTRNPEGARLASALETELPIAAGKSKVVQVRYRHRWQNVSAPCSSFVLFCFQTSIYLISSGELC